MHTGTPSVPCDELDLWLERYQDGELRGRARRAARDHIDQCETCRDRLEHLDSVGAVLRQGLGEMAPQISSAELTRRISDEVAGLSTEHPPPISVQMRGWAAAAAVAVAVFGGMLLIRSSRTPVLPVASAPDEPVRVEVVGTDSEVEMARVIDIGDQDWGVVWIGADGTVP